MFTLRLEPAHFFHLARAAAASFALTAGLLRRSFFLAAGFFEAFTPLPLYLAHLALAAAAIAARPARDMRRLPFGLPGPRPVPPMDSSWFCKSSICCLMSIIRRS